MRQSTRPIPSKVAALATVSAVLIVVGMSVGARSPAGAAATDVDLGTALSFSVLAGSTVTNTGPSVISGDLGVSPGTAVTGFPPGTVGGTIHADDAVADQAQSDLTAAYNNAAGQATDVTLSSAELGGLTLVPGVYTASSSAQLTGALTLDAQNDPDAVFIFQIGSTLTTASASSVVLINGADPCNIFWQVGSSATIGTDTTFMGTILALTSVTVNTGASIEGRALARNAAVTLDTNEITTPDCEDDGGGGVDVDGTDTTGTETDGADTAGTATTGIETDGVDTAGTATTGTETDGADTAGTETDGADTAGAATTGTETDGADADGTDVTGAETDGADTAGTATTGTETDGADTAGTATAGTETDGTDTAGTAAAGTETETDGADTNATDGTDTQGTDTGGTDADGTDSSGESNDDDDDDSSDASSVPKGHPETGMGGAAGDDGSMPLLALGGIAGLGSLVLSARDFSSKLRKRR